MSKLQELKSKSTMRWRSFVFPGDTAQLGKAERAQKQSKDGREAVHMQGTTPLMLVRSRIKGAQYTAASSLS